jgi:hypothetical protein
MRRLLPAVAGLLLALALPTLASAHEITNVDVDCDGQAIHVSGKLFGQDGGATVTVTGPDGYSESFFADQDEEWTVDLPLGHDGAYVIDWPNSGDFGPVDFVVDCIDENAQPTPAPAQFAFPTIGLTGCEEPGGEGAIVVSGFAATNGGELVINPGEGEIVITDNGTYDLDAGTYSAVIRFDGEIVAGPTEFTIEACPAAPTAAPTEAPETDVLPEEGVAPTPTGAALPAVGTTTGGGPTPTLPPTDTAASTDDGLSPASMASLALMGLAAVMAWVTLSFVERRMDQRAPSRSRAKSR